MIKFRRWLIHRALTKAIKGARKARLLTHDHQLAKWADEAESQLRACRGLNRKSNPPKHIK